MVETAGTAPDGAGVAVKMAIGNFSATVDDWVKKSERRMLAIFKESTQRTVSIAQSRIPVDTGFARASIRASTQSMPPIDRSTNNAKGGNVTYDGGEIILVIAGAELGQTVFIGWTANYVGFLEAGSSQQAPSGFVRLAAMQWQQTVAEVTAEAKARVG
jgi:HK97 gp10 family phage protein